MNKLTLFLTAAFALLAQSDSPNFTISESAPNTAYTTIYAYSGTNLSYSCSALSTQPATTTISFSTVSNANPGVATASNHGFYYASGVTQKILVYISGATGGWSTLNGLKVLVPASSGSFQILTTAGANFNTSGFGAWGAQSVTVTTRAPKASASVWSVKKYISDGSNLVTLVMNPVKINTTQSGLASLSGGSTAYAFPCSDPTIYQ